MKKITVRNVLAVFISLAMVHALAASASIGIATAKGSFRVDDSYVSGNATLFEGAAVETGVSTGELNLSKAKVVMATGTRARVYQDRMVLDRGKIQWTGAGYRTVAGEIEIVGAGDGSKALVERKGETVEVASLYGSVNVMTTSGESLMTIAAGSAYDFTPDPQGAAPGDKATTDEKDKNKKKKGAAAAGSTGAKTGLALGTKIAITVAAVGAAGATAGVLATRDSSSSNSR